MHCVKRRIATGESLSVYNMYSPFFIPSIFGTAIPSEYLIYKNLAMPKRSKCQCLRDRSNAQAAHLPNLYFTTLIGAISCENTDNLTVETIEASLNWLCPVLHQIPISRTGAASYARLSTAISYQEARRRKAARKACRLTTESTGAAPNGGMRFGTVSSGNANGGGGGGGENVAQQPDAFKYTEEDRNDMRTMFEQYTTYERVDPDENPISCTNLKSLYAGMLEKPNDTVDKHVVVYGM